MDPEQALSEGFGLTKKQRQLIIRVLWVLAVSNSILWMLGVFAYIGFASPLAKAKDVEDVQQQVAGIKQQVAISARLQLMSEIRTQKRLYCANPDEQVRQSIQRYLYSLVDDLRQVVPSTTESPIVECKP